MSLLAEAEGEETGAPREESIFNLAKLRRPGTAVVVHDEKSGRTSHPPTAVTTVDRGADRHGGDGAARFEPDGSGSFREDDDDDDDGGGGGAADVWAPGGDDDDDDDDGKS